MTQLLQRSVRTGLINRGRNMFSEQLERGVHRNAEMLGELLDPVIAERCTELIRRYRHIAAIAKP